MIRRRDGGGLKVSCLTVCPTTRGWACRTQALSPAMLSATRTTTACARPTPTPAVRTLVEHISRTNRPDMIELETPAARLDWIAAAIGREAT